MSDSRFPARSEVGKPKYEAIQVAAGSSDDPLQKQGAGTSAQDEDVASADGGDTQVQDVSGDGEPDVSLPDMDAAPDEGEEVHGGDDADSQKKNPEQEGNADTDNPEEPANRDLNPENPPEDALKSGSKGDPAGKGNKDSGPDANGSGNENKEPDKTPADDDIPNRNLDMKPFNPGAATAPNPQDSNETAAGSNKKGAGEGEDKPEKDKKKESSGSDEKDDSSSSDDKKSDSGDDSKGSKNPASALKSKAAGAAKNAAKGIVPDGMADTAMKVSNAFHKAQAVVQGIAASAKSAVAVMANPTSWVVTAIVVCLAVAGLLVNSTITVVGRNENADGCFGIGGDSGAASSFGNFSNSDDGDWTQRGNEAGSWLMSQKFDFLGGKGMSREQAAGILGNFIQESSITYAKAEMKGPNADGHLGHMSNAEADAFTKNYAPAGLGLAQWTWNPGRAKTLLDLAASMGKNWYDAEVQLTMIKNELDSTYGQRLLAQGFNDQGKSEKELALIFHEVYEGSADGAAGLKERQDSATEFLSKFTGASGVSSGSGSGGSCTKGGGAAGGSSNVVQFAISIAYPTKEESKCPEPNGYSCAPQAYKDAKHKMEAETGADPLNLWADCGRFAATVVKNTVDPEFPWGPTGTQYEYMSSHPDKWQMYTDYNQRQPGDIFITKPEFVGHIFVYLGNVDGVDKIAEASMEERVGGVGQFYLNQSFTEDYTVGGAHRQFVGFHYVGSGGAKK